MRMRVQNNEKFVQDFHNRAILNTDESAIKRHELKMEQLRKQKERDEEINKLRDDITELKQLLRELINGK